MSPIRILLADDHALFRDELRALLSLIVDIEVVGEAATGDEVITRAEELQPDVILMDIQMQGVNGIESTRRITCDSPHIGVIIVTMFEDNDSVFAAMSAGARGYVLKGADLDEMLTVIRSVASGDAHFGPEIARHLMSFFMVPKQPSLADAFPDLTAREREVFHLIARGKNNQEIASELYLSSKTVRNHISNIFAKLQVAGRAQAIVRAREAGLQPRRRKTLRMNGPGYELGVAVAPAPGTDSRLVRNAVTPPVAKFATSAKGFLPFG